MEGFDSSYEKLMSISATLTKILNGTEISFEEHCSLFGSYLPNEVIDLLSKNIREFRAKGGIWNKPITPE